MELTADHLTAEQRAAVESRARWLGVVGGPGAGKTTVLVERYRRLAASYRPSRVLVVCRDRDAAQRFLTAVLPFLRGGFDALPVTTVHGLAYDLLVRDGREVRLIGSAARRALLRRLLAEEEPERWPAVGRYLGRPGFAQEVERGLDVLAAVGAGAAEAAGGPWAELAGFAERYRAALAEAGQVDAYGLLEEAARRVAAGGGGAERFDHLLVDDADVLPAGGVQLVEALAGAETAPAVTVAAGERGALVERAEEEVRLPMSFRAAPPGTLVRCRHPAVETEAVAGELLAASRQGVPWSAMAVLVRRGGRRARSIGRALARHGIPVVPVGALAVGEPVVRAVVDLLRWVDGDDGALDRLLVSPVARLGPAEVRAVRRHALDGGEPLEADPRVANLVALRDRLRSRLAAGDSAADLAYEAWATGLQHVGESSLGAVDDRALDALVSFVDGLRRHVAAAPEASLHDVLAAIADEGAAADQWRTAGSAGADGVTICAIEAAGGREWHTVVVTGCVEGELPRVRARPALFDPAQLGVAGDPLAEERRLFRLATTRATGTLVATAAPEPGVLLSRFVEAWPEAPARLPLAPGQRAPARQPTAGVVPVWPDGRLTLSASQLETYDDCPLRYAYQYVLRARDEPGVHAGLGSLVHQILAEFLDPEAPDPAPRTLQGLLAVADRHWRGDVARYRPQVEEARRDLVAMLTAWWEQEGSTGLDVIAVERAFDIPVGPHRLIGSIDRVDRVDCGDGRVGLRVVDYKTGKREPAPGDVADDIQLAVYHLAATRDPELAALGPPVQLQLRYLRSMHTFSQPIEEGHAGRTEARVLAAAERILDEEFEPAVDANCRSCSFHRLCPLQQQGRQLIAAP